VFADNPEIEIPNKSGAVIPEAGDVLIRVDGYVLVMIVAGFCREVK
jgi:hypothetical protein